MNEPDLRALLYPLLSGGVYVDELPTGSTRADVVHITSGAMHGYELKGDNDTLKRVPNQLQCYAAAYDFVSFVVVEKHLSKLLTLLPDWAGILVARDGQLHQYRAAGPHEQQRRGNLVYLLHGGEVREFLAGRGERGLSKYRSNWLLQQWLDTEAGHISLAEIGAYVRQRLMERLPERLARRATLKKIRDAAKGRT